jgi:hypothetical protein
MTYLIGTDEAGYGPNFGPLVISATLWEAPDGVGGENLFERLGHVITPELRRSEKRDSVEKGDSPHLSERSGGCFAQMGTVPCFHTMPRVVMADSKKLYSPDKGLRHLERGLWAAFGLLDRCPQTWRGVWRELAPEALDSMRSVPWYIDYDGPVPSACDAAEIEPLADLLRPGVAAAGVRLLAIRSRAIFAHQFNDLVERHGSKGAALSHETLALAAAMIEPLPAAPISLICDKHGGRNCYGALLADHFPEWLIEVRGEGRQRSVYRFGPPDRRVEVCFRVKAESCLPAALASMASKYLRELAMQAFNEFWRRRVPGLQPTAGYPQDAKRFRADIAQTQRQLHISDRVLWRIK